MGLGDRLKNAKEGNCLRVGKTCNMKHMRQTDTHTHTHTNIAKFALVGFVPAGVYHGTSFNYAFLGGKCEEEEVMKKKSFCNLLFLLFYV